ncbi:hypothetical protein RQP46_007803 [Phenoliferia psychrophenolica]
MHSPTTAALLFLLGLAQLQEVSAFTRSWADARAMAQQKVASLSANDRVGLLTGVGQFNSRCTGNTHGVPGIPSICMNDGPSGVHGADLVSSFPAGITVAATFDRRLMQARGRALGEEFSGKGIGVFLGPSVDIMRSPKSGRAWEAFGPDPYLTAEAGAQTVIGVQSVGVMACIKHFLGYNQEHQRFTENSVIDDRTLHEVSDWGATHQDPAALANNGLDMEQPGDYMLVGGGVFGGGRLQLALLVGQVTVSTVVNMAIRILTPYYRLAQDQGFPATNIDVQHSGGSKNLGINVRSSAHTALIREIGAAGIVMLKNAGGILPLQPSPTLAVVGLDAAPPQMGCLLNCCDGGTIVTGWGSGTTALDFVVPPFNAIRDYLTSRRGSTVISSSLTDSVESAMAVARNAEVTIVFVHTTAGEIGGGTQNVGGNYGDRNDLNLFNNGDNLINGVATVCRNVIVVIHTVGPVTMEAWIGNPNVKAVLLAGLPGEQTGPSLVDVLYGAVTPSGKLPYTIAKRESDFNTNIAYGTTLDISQTTSVNIDYSERLVFDYRHFDQAQITPRFEFGIWEVQTQAWVVPEGVFTIEVGTSSRDIRGRTTQYFARTSSRG